MHLNVSLPTRIANGASREEELAVDKIRTVGGHEVRNAEWATPLRSWELPFPTMVATDADFIAVMELWKTVEGETHSFNFVDELEGESVRVRFEGKLRHSHVEGPYWQIDTLLLVEVRT